MVILCRLGNQPAEKCKATTYTEEKYLETTEQTPPLTLKIFWKSRPNFLGIM